MRARLLLNVGLLAAALGLAALLVLDPGREPPPEPVALTPLAPEAVTRVRIETPSHPAVVAAREGSGWRLEAPLALPADRMRMGVIVRAAGLTSETRYDAAAQEDLAAFGLASPKATLHLNDHVLAFGDTEPLSGRRYVLAGGTIHLIGTPLLHRLTGPPTGFVDPRPLAGGGELEAIELPRATLERADTGGWTLTPEHPELGADALQRLADAWRDARARAVEPLDDALQPEAEVRVRLQGRAAPLVFRVARREDAVILARPDAGIQYELAREAGETLLRLPAPERPEGG